MRALRVLPFVLLAACFEPGNAPSCTIQCSTDSDCTEGLTCGAGNLCTSGENCIEPATCTANEFIACVNDMARSCNAAGDGTTDAACGAPGCNTVERRCNTCIPDRVSCSMDMMAVERCMPDGSAMMRIDQCAAGCVPGTGMVAPHCAYISPAWIPDVCDTVAAMDTYEPNASATITTTLDTNCTGGVIMQPAGPPICVVRAKTITIRSNVTLTLAGTRSIAFVGDSLVDVIGTLDAGAEGRTSGPGGGARVSGTFSATAGGGGAGFGAPGANGSGTANGNGGPGGPSLDPITLSYFGGGARAGSGTGIFDPGGGGGGGAVMLVACRGLVRVSGVIDAGGGGGGGQYDTVLGGGISQSRPAAGGGSGGYVVIQGLNAAVSGQIYANGGGGGGGNTADDGPNTSGGDGLRTTSQSSGGAAGGAGGLGGRGGALGVAALTGGPTTAGSSAGAGGGGVGILQIYTPMGVAPVTTGATVSPGFTAKKNSMMR